MNELSAQRQIGASREDVDVVLPAKRDAARASADSACSFVISDVSTMKTTGARKAIAATISRL